jgi:IclR family acetate operon transcriptional repressor
MSPSTSSSVPPPDDEVAGAAPRTGSQAVDRALAVLSLFIDATVDGLTLTEVAGSADLRPSTAHRLLRALVRAGYLEQDATTERYRLGTTSALLGRAAGSALGLDLARPVLERLAAATGESVSIGVLDGADVVILLAVDSAQPLRMERSAGARVAAHASAIGKAILAFDPHGSSAAVRSLGDLASFTPSTLSRADDLVAHLEQIRADGLASNREERYPGAAAVAAPILDRRGHARAAVGVQLPAVRFDGPHADLVALQVREAAVELASLVAVPQR